MSILRRLERRAAAEWGNSDPPTNGQLSSAATGMLISEQTALQVAAVYGSVSVLADGVSTLPIELLAGDDPANRRVLPPSPLISQPYAEISLIDWLVQYTFSLALRGNFYGHIIERDRNLYPVQIKPIHPDRARVRRLPSGELQYTFNNEPVKLDDVLHIRYQSVSGSLVGLNPIEYLRTSLGLARGADLFGASFFANSALPSGTINVEEDLDPEEALALARNWLAAHQGLGKANLPAVLTNGAKFEAISVNPQDAQFLESRAFSQTEISGLIFRVPPHMIGIVDKSTSWGTGIEQQEMGFVRNTLSGYLSRIATTLTALHPPGQRVKFNLSERERGDRLQRYQGHSLGILGGFLCPDDIRTVEDLPPLPDGMGRNFLTPINTELLAKAIKDSQTPPASPQGAGNTGGGQHG